MLKQSIADLISKAVAGAQKAGKLPAFSLPEIIVEPPQDPDHGDYSSSLALKLAREARMKPLDIARAVIGFIAPSPEIEKVDIATPGFINFTLKNDWLAR